MFNLAKGPRIYTVVDVVAGVAVGVETFGRSGHARAWLRQLRRDRDLERDDVQLFESIVHDPSKRRGKSQVGATK